jgi:hypothetical protein
VGSKGTPVAPRHVQAQAILSTASRTKLAPWPCLHTGCMQASWAGCLALLPTPPTRPPLHPSPLTCPLGPWGAVGSIRCNMVVAKA